MQEAPQAAGGGRRGPARSRQADFQLTPEQELEVREAFEMFDTDGSGSITVQEWRVAMRAMGFESMKEENRLMLAEMDRDNSGSIEYDEFYAMVKKRLFMRSARQEMHKLFLHIVEGGLGIAGSAGGVNASGTAAAAMAGGRPVLELDRLRAAAARSGEPFGEDELRDMMEEADRDGDGLVTEDDF
ncbi:Centrin-4, partial [Cladochytrium tenue]